MEILEILIIDEERRKQLREQLEIEALMKKHESLKKDYEVLKSILSDINEAHHNLLKCEMEKNKKLRDINETYKEELNKSKQDNIELKKEIDKVNELYSRQTQIMLKQSMPNYTQELLYENESLQNNLDKYKSELKLVREENIKLKEEIEKSKCEDYHLYDFVNANTGKPSHIYARDLKEALNIKKMVEQPNEEKKDMCMTIFEKQLNKQEKQFKKYNDFIKYKKENESFKILESVERSIDNKKQSSEEDCCKDNCEKTCKAETYKESMCQAEKKFRKLKNEIERGKEHEIINSSKWDKIFR